MRSFRPSRSVPRRHIPHYRILIFHIFFEIFTSKLSVDRSNNLCSPSRQIAHYSLVGKSNRSSLPLFSRYCFINRPHQKVKFQSFIKYFDWLESQATTQEQQQHSPTTKSATENQEKPVDGSDTFADDTNACIKVSRKVFSGKQWLTIEDWLECAIPLCALEVKHEGRIERSPDNVVQTIFASARLGGDFLSNGWSQVCYKIAAQFSPFLSCPKIISNCSFVLVSTKTKKNY